MIVMNDFETLVSILSDSIRDNFGEHLDDDFTMSVALTILAKIYYYCSDNTLPEPGELPTVIDG